MPPPARIRAALVAASLLACLGCEQASKQKLLEAEHQLARGQLDRVLALLEDSEGAEADALRATVARRKAERGEVDAALQEHRARRADLEPLEAQATLRALLKSTEDPVACEAIRVQLSGDADWYAARPSRTPRAAGAASVGGASVSAPASGPSGPAGAEPEPPADVASELPLPAEGSAAEVSPAEVSPAGVSPVGVSPVGAEGTPASAAPRAPAGAHDRPASETPYADACARAERAEQDGALDLAEREWSVAAEHAPDPRRRAAAAHRSWLASQRRAMAAALPGVDLDDPRAVDGALASLAPTPERTLWRAIQRARSGADPEATSAALDDLARLADEGHLQDEEASPLVAALLREELPRAGYTLRRGQWVSVAELDLGTRLRQLDRLDTSIDRASAEQRAWLAADAGGVIGDSQAVAERWGQACAERWRKAVRTLERAPARAQLERLAQQRDELDRLRAVALAAIEDEDRYFYPYQPPDDPAKTYGDYVLAQREVGAAVAAVEELWTGAAAVELPEPVLDAFADLAWLSDPALAGGEHELPAGWPRWLTRIDPRRSTVTLRELVRDADEARLLVEDRALVALNEGRWAALDATEAPDGPDAPDAPDARELEERALVRAVNEYRAMLGRRPLAWDPRLQRAALRHARYMDAHGALGHDEPDRPGFVTPGDRMQSEGYDAGLSEICHTGDGPALRVLAGWRTSSGHHRNLLSEEATETGLARFGTYWAQVFGGGADYRNELDSWRD